VNINFFLKGQQIFLYIIEKIIKPLKN